MAAKLNWVIGGEGTRENNSGVLAGRRLIPVMYVVRSVVACGNAR